jgi:hypothetical protein
MMEWATGGGISQMGWNAIWLGAGGTNACSAWPQGGNAACGPCPPVNGQCVGEVTNGAQYEMTGWPSFDHHAWHTYGLLGQNTGNDATDQMTYFIDGVRMGVFNLGAAQSAFKADMFVTVNMALGGTLGAPIQITDWADAHMDIDYIRWYRTGQPDVCGLGAGSGGGADASSDAGPDATVEGGLGATSDAGVDESADDGDDGSVDAAVDAEAGPPPPAPVQINAGGAGVAPYAADKDFSGGTTIDHANAIDVSAVSNPAPVAVYQSARVNNFTYTVPGFVAGSSHTVRLHFAETHFSTSGSRTFNVAINGGQVLTKFDIYKTAGAKNKAIVETFTVNADSSGDFVIKFTSVVNQSLVSAVEIE